MTGKSRAVFAVLPLAAIAFALGLSSAPRLHVRSHHGDSTTHGYAATLLPVCGISLTGTLAKRLLVGWIIALIGGVASLFLSFYWDLSSGAAIVCTFGALLLIVTHLNVFLRHSAPTVATD